MDVFWISDVDHADDSRQGQDERSPSIHIGAPAGAADDLANRGMSVGYVFENGTGEDQIVPTFYACEVPMPIDADVGVLRISWFGVVHQINRDRHRLSPALQMFRDCNGKR